MIRDGTASKSPTPLESPLALLPMLPALVNRGYTCFYVQNAASLSIERPFLLLDYKNLRMQSVCPDPTPPQLMPCPVRLRQIVPMPPEDHHLTERRCPRLHLYPYTIAMEVELFLE